MKATNFLFSLFLTVSLFSITSCSKKEGCTDPTSINYNASAKKDNGTCEYKGSVVFFVDSDYAISGYGQITITMADNTTGVITVGKTVVPSCNANGCFTYTAKAGTYSYTAISEALDANNEPLKTWSGSATVTSQGCLAQGIIL